MEYRPLGDSGIEVSVIGLGTMTFGEQNSAAEAAAQLDFALERGVNFIDTAEMYPVPPHPDTQGRTEAHIGAWLKAGGRRDRVVLASKVAGRGDQNAGVDHLRGGPRLDAASVRTALEGSLTRLGTDYLDLYQVHWPERRTNFFGHLGYRHFPADDDVAIAETHEALGELVKEGKVRHVGVSNETPWGVLEYLRLAREAGLPRIVSIQNPYNLLNRSFEVGLAEIAIRERVGLLAYSPLAFGLLSGKYAGGARPDGARLTLFPRFARYDNPQATAATDAYLALAADAGLDPAQLALAFVNRQPFVTSNIIGATTLEQLAANIASIELELPRELCKALDAVHQQYPNPAP